MKKLYTVVVKEWFDKFNGNSYCAVQITKNSTGELLVAIPFQYGYGQYGEQLAKEWLKKNRPTLKMNYLNDRANCIKIEGCKKRDVVSFGEGK